MSDNEAIKRVEEFVFKDREMRQDVKPEEWNDYDIFCEENNVAMLKVIAMIRDLRVENTKLKYMVKNRERRISQLTRIIENNKSANEDLLRRNIQLLDKNQKLQNTIDKS